MGEGVCWLIISLTFVVATGVTVIISVFSLPAGFGAISYKAIVPQDTRGVLLSIMLVLNLHP
jgi:hypothetical protein